MSRRRTATKPEFGGTEQRYLPEKQGSKVPLKYREQFLEMYAQGKTMLQISEWFNSLKLVNNGNVVKISRGTVGKIIRKSRAERAALSKPHIVAAAMKTAVGDVEIVSDMISDLYGAYKLFRDTGDDPSFAKALTVQRELRGWISIKFEVIGATLPTENLRSSAQEEVMNQLNQILVEARKNDATIAGKLMEAATETLPIDPDPEPEGSDGSR